LNVGPVISSIKDPVVVEARRALGQAGGAAATAYVVDGLKLASQAVYGGAPVLEVFYCAPLEDEEHLGLLRDARAAGIPCFLLNRGVFFKLLGLGYETAARVLVLVEIRVRSEAEALDAIGPDTCLMLGQKIADPRNVGVILRNADATGTSMVALTRDSADAFSRESVRSSTGSIFRMPVAAIDDLLPFVARLKARGVTVYGTSAQGASVFWEVQYRRPCAVLFGNETRGLSDDAREACDTLLRIPMMGGAHSFNVTVANGIILCEIARQRLEARRGGL
jgi:tRNA G18 (ribose-2'-O)-methylase SpoU